MAATELTLSVTEFKAKCLGLLEQVGNHTLTRLTITKHGKPLAEIGPPTTGAGGLDGGDWNPFGHMAGRAVFPDGFDPAAAAFDPSIDGALPGDEEAGDA